MATPVYSTSRPSEQGLAGNSSNCFANLDKVANTNTHQRRKAYRLGILVVMFVMLGCIPIAITIHAKTQNAHAKVQRATYELVQDVLPCSIIRQHDRRKNTTP